MSGPRFVPLLERQRFVYELPRGRERFARYLSVLTGVDTGLGPDMELPLALFNPMGKTHVSERLDALIAIDAEGLAATAVDQAAKRLPRLERELRVGLVLVDDFGGGWTHRFTTEASHHLRSLAELKRGWVTALLWTGEALDPVTVVEETMAAVFRAFYQGRFSLPRTVDQAMRQEGLAAAFAAARGPNLPEKELAEARDRIEPHRDADAYPRLFACLYGDAAASSIGLDPLGLPARAGLAVALAEARSSGRPPEECLGDRVKIGAKAKEKEPWDGP